MEKNELLSALELILINLTWGDNISWERNFFDINSYRPLGVKAKYLGARFSKNLFLFCFLTVLTVYLAILVAGTFLDEWHYAISFVFLASCQYHMKMSNNTWEEIQNVRDSRANLRNRLAQRKKERQNIVKDVTASVLDGSASKKTSQVLQSSKDDSHGVQSASITEGTKSSNKAKEESNFKISDEDQVRIRSYS